MVNSIIPESSNTLLAGGTDDIIIKERGLDTGTVTIDAGAGNDVVYTSHDQILVDNSASNTSIATAADLDPVAFWSTLYNPDVGDDTVPHASILVDGSNAIDVFSVTVGSLETITIDLDYGFLGPGNQLDAEVFLKDAAGNILVSNDNAGAQVPEGAAAPARIAAIRIFRLRM